MQNPCHRPSASGGPTELLRESFNCWRIDADADAEVLIDAADYFEHLYRELQRARQQVIILAWDFDTRVALLREDMGRPTGGSHFAALVRRLTHERRDLRIHILCWKAAPIFILDREIFQRYKLGWRNLGRINFRYDAQHPISASHHQKIVVIDDRIAYCGGLDLTKNRWDTAAHAACDHWRVNSAYVAYEPFHDTQVAVYGKAAAHLGEMCRERWAIATDERLPTPPRPSRRVPPLTLKDRLMFRGVKVGIARTLPNYKGNVEVREVQQLFSDMLRGARRYVYIENQYVTARCIGRDLAASLRQPQGPQIVVVLPSRPEGLLERNAMFALQLRLFEALRQQDPYDRLRVFCPIDADLPPTHQIKVHSKVMVVDDRWLRVGSANLNNRSMGLDTECDVLIDAGDSLHNRRKIREFVAESASHFVDMAPAELAARWHAESLGAALGGAIGNKRLIPVEASKGGEKSWIDDYVTGTDLLDPDAPYAFEQMFEEVVYEATHERLFRKAPLGLLMTAVFAMALGLLWVASPLGDFLSGSRLAELLAGGATGSLSSSLAYVALVFVLAGLLFFPLNMLIVAMAALLPGWHALFGIMLGGLASAVCGYGIGRAIKLPFLERLMPKYLHKVRARVDASAILPLVVIRLMPVAPFSLVNLIAGAAHVPLGAYLAGTALGLLPGVACLVFLQKSLYDMLRAPSVGSVSAFALVAALLVACFVYLQKRLTRYERGTA